MIHDSNWREPVVAGHFYPAEPGILSHRVGQFLEGEQTLPAPGPIGLVCPHAGYDYSGAVAGRAYRELRDRGIEAVVVLGPSHQDRFHGVTAWPGLGYRTPLGTLEAPAELSRSLEEEQIGFELGPLGHRDEHSVEVQLPFLQEVAPDVPVLPLILAEDSPETCKRIGQALARVIGDRRVVLVASTDLYHGSSDAECRRTDRGTLEALERNDPDELAAGFGSGAFQACGRAPVQVVLEACRGLGAEKVHVLESTNSNEVTGQLGQYVVGYAAAAITRD